MRISKRLILILLAIIAITLTCVISSSEAYESEFKGGSIGDTLKISYLNGTWGDNWPYSYEYNKNIYCMQKGTKPGEGAFTIKTIVEITNDQITSAKGTNSNGAEVDFLSKIKEHQTSSDVKNANAQLAKIVELADKAKASRERTYGDGMLMQKDPYQWLMWRHLDTWVNTSIYNGNSTLKSELKSHFHGSANYNSSYNSAAKSSYDKSNTIWNEQIKNYKSSQELVDISLKTDENKSVIENYNTYQENGVNYSILGPFYLTYGGTISEFKVKLSGDTELDVSKDFKVGVYTGDSQSFEIIEDLKNIPKNGNEIYLSIAEDKLQNKTKLDVNIKVKGTSSRVTTIYILKNNNGKQMYMGTKQTLGPGEVSASATYTLNLNEDVVLKKQNENGEAVPGVKFEIHNSEGEYEGTFTTNENGETNVIKLKAGETYTITEILNSEYGYKDVTIADAEITKGAGKITNVIQADNKFDVVITEDTTITIKNTSKLGKFTLVKEGENAEPLEGVQFVVYQSGLPGYEGYLKFESLIEGFGTVDALDFNRKYVTDRNEATIFTTGKDGMITIENLEVYSGPSTKFGYWVTEINNENYGYKKIELTDTDVKINDNGEIITSKTEVDKNTVGFEIHKQAVLTIPNKQELAKLEIEKVGENGTKLENVQIKIKVGEEQYIQLTDSNETIVKEVKGQVTINPNNIANLQEYKVNYITSKADATIFKTDENGKITINNLEVNASNTKKYSYTACEIYNPNYGYGSVENINLEEKLIELKLN